MASYAAREKRQLMEAAVESASQAQAQAAVAAREAKVRMQEDTARIVQQQAKEAADLEAAQKELARVQEVARQAAEAALERKRLMARKVEAEVQRRRAEQARAVQQEEAVGRRRGGRVFLDSMHNNTALNI